MLLQNYLFDVRWLIILKGTFKVPCAKRWINKIILSMLNTPAKYSSKRLLKIGLFAIFLHFITYY